MNVFIYGSGRQGQRWKGICEKAGHSVDFSVKALRANGNSYGEPPDKTDAIIVATPPDHHMRPTITALRLGIPVLVEKPLARRIDQNRRILEALLATGSPLLVGYTHLFSRFFAEQDFTVADRVHIQWTGEQRADGTCSADLDWGCHAVAMATVMRQEGCKPTMTIGQSVKRHRVI